MFLANFIFVVSHLKVQSCKVYNNKYMIASAQLTHPESFAFVAIVVF